MNKSARESFTITILSTCQPTCPRSLLTSHLISRSLSDTRRKMQPLALFRVDMQTVTVNCACESQTHFRFRSFLFFTFVLRHNTRTPAHRHTQNYFRSRKKANSIGVTKSGVFGTTRKNTNRAPPNMELLKMRAEMNFNCVLIWLEKSLKGINVNLACCTSDK